jgi:hypothetical protein
MKHICCLCVFVETYVDFVDMESAFVSKSVSLTPHVHRNVIASRCLAMDYSGFEVSCHNIIHTGGEQNNGNIKKLRNIICVVCTETISVCNTEYLSSFFSHSVVLVLSDSSCEVLGKYKTCLILK